MGIEGVYHEWVMDRPHVLRVCNQVIDVLDGRRLVKKADLTGPKETDEVKKDPKVGS